MAKVPDSIPNILCIINDGLCPLANGTQATREKLFGDWSFGEDGGEMVSMLASNK